MNAKNLSLVIAIICFALILVNCFGHVEEKLNYAKRPVDLINYSGAPLQEAIFSDAIYEKIENRELRLSRAYNKLIQIGKYREVNSMTDLKLDWGLDTLKKEELNHLDSFSFFDASTEIIQAAKEHDLVIVTESHTKPNHRVFTSQLLKDLFDNGYTSLGLENINPLYEDGEGRLLDSLMNDRGYPLVSLLSGIYTSESHYANLIREAKRIGFNIFAYERNGSSDSERDQQQAEHIFNYMSEHPDEKVICYGGWYHAIELPILKRGKEGDFWMAYELKQMSGKDPLTVYLDAFNEKISTEVKSSPYYDFLIKKFGSPEFPVVLKNNKGEFYNGENNHLPFDILTVSPKDKYDENGLANWLQYYNRDSGWEWVDFSTPINKVIEKNYPVMIKILEPYTNDLATPIHCYELKEKVDEFKLPVFLKKNRLIIIGRNGAKLFDEII